MYVPIKLNQVQLKDFVSSEIKNLYDFALKNNFDEFTTLSTIRKKLKENFDTKIENYHEYKNIVSRFRPFDKENFILENDAMDIYEVSNLLKQAIDEVLYFVDPNKKVSEGYILKRQVDPSLKAFEKVGHNLLKIYPSGRDYGLLYE